MADPVLTQHEPLNQNPVSKEFNSTDEQFNSLPVPPLDPVFLNQENFVSDLPCDFDDNCDFDITFEDLSDLYFTSENEQFLLPNSDPGRLPDNPDFQPGSLEGYFEDFAPNPIISESPKSGSSGICHNHAGSSEVDKYLNPSPSEAGSCDSGCSGGGVVGDNPSSDSCQLSSHGLENAGSDVLSVGSPESGTNGNCVNFVVEQKIVKTESVSVKKDKIAVTKRKKETGDAENSEILRNSKSRRGENDNVSVNVTGNASLSDEDEKRKARLMRNRESAQLSRQRKKHYVEELEDKVRAMHSTIAELNGKVSYFMAENASLRQQLSGNGACPPPMYAPMAPYPWMPCAPYVVKPQGSQVPLVPIPRLKPQQAASPGKAKKVESKKGEGKTKKVASVSLLGLLFFIFLFGGLVPIMDVKFGGVRENGIGGFGFVSEKFYDQHKGRVLIVDGHTNGSRENVGAGFSNSRIHCDKNLTGSSEHLPGSDEFGQFGNESEPLAASLYVPRNDKLVKIDGNLIIHSVLASERAMASHEAPEVNITKETALAIPDAGSNRGRHPHLYRTASERQKALSSGSDDTSKDNRKSSASNGKLQQWFREGLAGPMLSSGMCTEVFQFDVSPAPGAIVPAPSVTNVTAEHRRNNTAHLKKRKNRRILHGVPIPLSRSDLNITSEHVGRNSQNDSFQGNKSVSPMVVSVLVDPREASDIDVDGVLIPKSLSRIFVVVLLDSIKYVTYSCVLPGTGPHLVTT